MALFDKDSIGDLVSATMSAVNRPVSKGVEDLPPKSFENIELFRWFVNGDKKEKCYDRVFDIYDVGHPDIGNVLSPQMTQKVFQGGIAEAEVLASMMVSVLRPRLFKNQEMRDRARRVKSMCKVGMRSIYVVGENGHYSSPSNMKPLLRHSSYEKVHYDKLESCAKDFAKINLVEIHNLVSRIVNHMRELDESDLWLGFHRVKPTLAASTLARFHSLEWSDVFNLSCPLTKLPDFLVKSELADQVNAAAEDEAMSAALFLKSTAIRDRAKRDFRFVNLTYKPRMYPIHEFPSMPANTAKIISMVEKMPELGGRPAFDYLWVLVPGFSMNHPAINHPDGLFRVMIDGKLLETKSEDEVSAQIDKKLINEGIIMPCVLGERDGKCYFVCPWI